MVVRPKHGLAHRIRHRGLLRDQHDWQSSAGDAGTGYGVQALGLTVQSFLSAAVGLAVAIALVRGLARRSADRIGNFWVDLVRGIVRILLPLAAVAAVVLLAGGVLQNLTTRRA